MGKSVYFNNCLREIRQCVFGRDNRKPIADAISMAKDTMPLYNVKWLNKVEVNNDTNVIDWIEQRSRTVYVNYRGDTSSTGIAVTTNDSGETVLVDSRMDDTGGLKDRATLISGSDYLLTVNNNDWSASGLAEDSYIVYDQIPHYESYTLTLTVS